MSRIACVAALVFWLGLMGLLIFYAKLDIVSGPGRLDVGYEDIVDQVTGILMLGLTFISVGYHSIKAAWTNPVDSLQNE